MFHCFSGSMFEDSEASRCHYFMSEIWKPGLPDLKNLPER